MSDAIVRSGEGLILVVLVVSYALAYAIRRLRRRRPDFRIGLPVFTGVTLRLLAVAAINATGLQSQLRGGDETTFLDLARALATQPLGRGFLPHGPNQLHTVLFALQIKLLDLSTTALRVTQIGLATLGMILIFAAVYDLAGGRAARLAAWILALEPASIFFNSALHKEPLMVLASGLVVFGGTKIWQRLDFNGALLAALGGLIAVETRSYAGWFLVSAAVFLLLHAALRKLDRPFRAMPIVYAVAVTIFLVTPTLLSVTSKKSLQTLQQSQNYTTGTQAAASAGGAGGDNLALEQVDFSSRGAVISNLPKRVFDVIFRPYPWQLQDASQQLGAIGTLIALAGLFLLLRYVWRRRGHVFAEIGPILYPLFFLLIAYSLTAGNAGTGFRYRTHLVVLGTAALVVVREHALRARSESRAREPASVGGELGSQPLGSTLLPGGVGSPLGTDSAEPLVSFVVPTFRRPDALHATLEALTTIDYPPARYELVVVDDGPDDRTAAVVESFAGNGRSLSLVSQENRGVATARNRGAAAAAGDLLIFVDDDIIVEPDHVRRHLAARAGYGDCLVNGHWEFSPATLDALQASPFGRFRVGIEDWVKTGIVKDPLPDGRFRPSGVTACNLSISANLFRELGGFDESFPFAGCEDQEFSLRAKRAGCTFVYDRSIRLQHNDQRVTLEQFCSRQRRGALTSVYLAARHPEQFADRALLLENAPATRFDPPRLRVKKTLKTAYSTPTMLKLARLASRVLERLAPDSRALKRIYTMTIGAHIFIGVRDGLGRLPEARAAAETAMRNRYASA
jgi:GT2 family glycosyltransferase